MHISNLKSIYYGQFPVQLKVFIMSEKFEKNHKKINDIKVIRDHFRKAPEAREHDFELISASGNHQKTKTNDKFSA